MTLPSGRSGSIVIIGPMEDLSSRIVDPATLGEPSEAALLAVERLDRLEPPDGPDNASTDRSEEPR